MGGECGCHATARLMTVPNVYIDGQSGTTALKISEILSDRKDLQILRLPDQLRKDEHARRDAIAQADVAILCLPDEAAVQAAQWAAASTTRVIDASTAHRVSDDWIYGLPEIGSEFRESIRAASFVANPGCYPTSAILLLRPLIEERILCPDSPIVIHALSGYSGGGRKLIERWERDVVELNSLPYSALYALDRVHKHIPEMMKYSGLKVEPQFLPRVGAFLQGMRIEIPVHAFLLQHNGEKFANAAFAVLSERYRDEQFIEVKSGQWEGVTEFQFDPRKCNGTNQVDLSVVQHPSGHIVLIGILDNLGKGASGAAVQSLNLMLGFPENAGLMLG